MWGRASLTRGGPPLTGGHQQRQAACNLCLLSPVTFFLDAQASQALTPVQEAPSLTQNIQRPADALCSTLSSLHFIDDIFLCCIFCHWFAVAPHAVVLEHGGLYTFFQPVRPASAIGRVKLERRTTCLASLLGRRWATTKRPSLRQQLVVWPACKHPLAVLL